MSLVELMGADALEDAIVMIGEDDISLGVELEDEMVSECLTAKTEDNHSFNPNLPDGFQSFGAQILAETHCEP